MQNHSYEDVLHPHVYFHANQSHFRTKTRFETEAKLRHSGNGLLPFTADMVRRALNTRNVLIPERFASTPGASVIYLGKESYFNQAVYMYYISVRCKVSFVFERNCKRPSF